MRMKTGLLQSIIKKVIVILPFYLFTFLPLTAQTFTQRIQKTTAGEGTITIHQDTAIDELVNGPVSSAKPAPAPKKTTPAPVKPATKAKDTPVTQIKVESGKSTVTFFRLLPVAPTMVSFSPLPLRLLAGI